MKVSVLGRAAARPALASASMSSAPTAGVVVVQQRRGLAAPVGSGVPAGKKKYVPTSGTYPQGFRAGGVVVGVKPGNTTRPDLAMIASDVPCAAAAVFTKNAFQAAPVTFSKGVLARAAAAAQKGQPPVVRSVLVNAGCANAVTGRGGLADAEAMARAADGVDATLVLSTGVIGQRLPLDRIVAGVPALRAALGADHAHWLAAARAICTTDTFPKLRSRSFALPSWPGVVFCLAGTTKGAGMIHPNMATLLGILATDAPLAPEALQPLLRHAVDRSFNCISVDGDTSTNDTVALLANGAAVPVPPGAGGSPPPVAPGSPDYAVFQAVLADFAAELAQLVVRDGEGATKFVTVRVLDAARPADARRVAAAVARSPLVKTALYGRDANWGRILCATGYALISEPGEDPLPSGGSVQPATTTVSFVPADGSPELRLLVDGEPQPVDEARAAEILDHEDLEICVRLGTGSASATYWTCDFSHEYVYASLCPALGAAPD